jgi:hypothetical protein
MRLVDGDRKLKFSGVNRDRNSKGAFNQRKVFSNDVETFGDRHRFLQQNATGRFAQGFARKAHDPASARKPGNHR